MAIIMAGIVIVSSQTFRFIRRSTPSSGARLLHQALGTPFFIYTLM